MYYGHNRRISQPWHINEWFRKLIAKSLVDRNEEDDERISKENKLNKGEES